MPGGPPEPPHWPRFCCAVILDDLHRYLLERRPPEPRFPRGRLTCFGGGRELHESPDDCIQRELAEELGWRVPTAHLRHAVTLIYQGPDRPWRRGPLGPGNILAWFYTLDLPAPPDDALRPEHGVRIERLPHEALALSDLSPWHLAALEGLREGRPEVVITR
jgi:8-oxo-dGTP pyrophosphatase MutT (NUDIX family)